MTRHLPDSVRRRSRRSRPAWAPLALVALLGACGGGYSSPPPTAPPSSQPSAFDVSFVGSTPAPGSPLRLSGPNDTPVALSVTFSVSVPAGRQGAHQWNTAVQAEQPAGTGFFVPIATTAFRSVTLEAGVHELVVSDFHTTNAICIDLRRPTQTLGLDIDVRAAGASLGQGGPQVLGKRFEVTWPVECE